MAKKTKQEAQQERLSLAEKRNRQERRNKKSRKEREQEKRRKKQERDRRKQKNIPTTAQQSIPYIRMLQDGICQVTKTFFSKTIQFYDINYQLALNEDKTTIFENYCDFLNYFDSSISVQLSFINQQVDVAEFEKSIRFLYKGIIIKHNKTEPTYTKTSLFLCEKRRFFMARTEKGVVMTI